jgi:hypothetical protein
MHVRHHDNAVLAAVNCSAVVEEHVVERDAHLAVLLHDWRDRVVHNRLEALVVGDVLGSRPLRWGSVGGAYPGGRGGASVVEMPIVLSVDAYL